MNYVLVEHHLDAVAEELEVAAPMVNNLLCLSQNDPPVFTNKGLQNVINTEMFQFFF